MLFCCGRPKSTPSDLKELLLKIPPLSACIVFESWLYSSIRAGRALDTEGFSCIHLVPGPQRGCFARRFQGSAPHSALLGIDRRLPELPVLSLPPSGGSSDSASHRVPGHAAMGHVAFRRPVAAQQAATGPALAGCVFAVSGFTASTHPSRAQVVDVLLSAGACVLSIAYSHLISHLLVYVPCPAVAIGGDGLVSHKLPSQGDAGACAALEHAGTLGTLVPIARADAASAPPQHPAALAEAEEAERWYRELKLLNADSPQVYAVTPLSSARSSVAVPTQLDDAPSGLEAGLGSMKAANADTAARGIVAQAGLQPIQSLETSSGFVLEAVVGRVATPDVLAEVQTEPLDAPNWIWRKSMSGCARAYLASTAGAAVVTGEWLANSLSAGRPLNDGAGVLSQLGSGAPLPCLHEVITAARIMQVADEADMVRPADTDELYFLLCALRQANGWLHPSAPWQQAASAPAQPPSETLFAMTTGYKAAEDSTAMTPLGCASAQAASQQSVAVALSAWGGVSVLAAAEHLSVPASGRPKHAFDSRCRMLVVWGLARVEKLCATLACGGWVLWPSVHVLPPGGAKSAAVENKHAELAAHEVCIASSSSRQFGKVFAGAPRAWRLHGLPVFRDWVFLLLKPAAAAKAAQGPPLDMLHRVLLAGGAQVHVIGQLGDVQLSTPVLPSASVAPAEGAAAVSAAAAADEPSQKWPAGRILQPHVVVIVTANESSFDPFAQSVLAAAAAAPGAAGRTAVAGRGWPLDYLTQEVLPAFMQLSPAA